MKRLVLFGAMLIISAAHLSVVHAQTNQQVQILEYNGKAQKTPIQGVNLSVNNAPAAMSDANGALTLNFRTLKAGDPVVIRRIEKSGYEIFNLDAVQQWIISPDVPFQLVICKSDQIRTLCEQYSSIASQSYGKQLQQEKARLAEERKKGLLKEEEYQTELQKTEDFYAQQLENLDLYVEKFAHFDLSELSEQEFSIIELVQKGEIEEAIAHYEKLNLLSQYKNATKQIQSIRTTQDSLTSIRNEKTAARDSLKSTIDFMEEVKKK